MLALVEYCCAQPEFPTAHALNPSPIGGDLVVLAEASQKPAKAAGDQPEPGVAIIEQVTMYPVVTFALNVVLHNFFSTEAYLVETVRMLLGLPRAPTGCGRLGLES